MNEISDTGGIGHNEPPKAFQRPPQIKKSEIDKLTNKDKFGKRAHVGLTFKMIQAFGGLGDTMGRQEPAPFFEQIYEPDDKELEDIRKKRVLVEDDGKRPPRSWREDRNQKIRCGQISVSKPEAEHMLYHLSVGIGREAASLFTPKDMVQLTPGEIIDRILQAGVGLIKPLHDPVTQLRLLADLCSESKATIAIRRTGLRMTDQGDGRADDLRVTNPLPSLKYQQEFVLDIQLPNPNDSELFVFEYAGGDLEKPDDPTGRLALPMPYWRRDDTGVLVTRNDGAPLRAGKLNGQFGFAAVTLVPRKKPQAESGEADPTLLEIIGDKATAPCWTREDLQQIAGRLRHHVLRGELTLGIAMLDYELNPG